MTFKAHAGPYEGSIVDELIADRRREAVQEEAETEEWLARIGQSK